MSNITVQHLYQIYPQMPQYAADVSQSPFIETYDSIMNRFQGHYGKQPTYFIRSPACFTLFGDLHQYVSYNQINLASLQNIVIAISSNSQQQIRLNNFQKAMYGEQIYPSNLNDWKVDKNSDDEYLNLLIATLKVTLGFDKNYSSKLGMDILIYCDFINEQFIGWKSSMIFAIITSILVISHQKNIESEHIQAISKKVHSLLTLPYYNINPLQFQYNKLTVQQTLSKINFPSNLDIVIAHSLTPLPHKLVKGKRFNLRRCQVLIGIQFMKVELGISKDIKSLKQLQQNISCSLNELIQSVQEIIPKGNLTLEHIQQSTDKTLIDILKEVPYANCVIDQNTHFQPYMRIMCLLKQQQIVEKIIQQKQIIQQNKQNWEKLLIQSMVQNAKNSKIYLNQPSDQINTMLKVSQGLYKAYRILGNGWGGNLLFICDHAKANALVDTLINQFYLSNQNKILLSDDIETYVKNIEKPSNGLLILNPESQIWY